MTRLAIAGMLGVLAAASISVAASWAQQREARVIPGPMTERPIHVVKCAAGELAQCKATVSQRCGSDNICVAEGVAGCEARCELQH